MIDYIVVICDEPYIVIVKSVQNMKSSGFKIKDRVITVKTTISTEGTGTVHSRRTGTLV